ncbi:MAG: PAS domain-containing protein [Leptospiraceae bacterium]|nr:PAS domain-containing protein [Leptospiraceae bacterium]MCP5495619.1 PAS domain-containing protein [Leptospiraceae bacterium]
MSIENYTKEQNLIPTYYVGIGASAGGLEAIEAFFSNMPPATGFSFILVQHLSPTHKSMMVEILPKRTKMSVYVAVEGMLVEPNAIYLIPPKKNLTIVQGRLILNEQETARGINLPIDIFLRSLAEDQKEKAIAVILSGAGSDGIRGIRAIKEEGGMVVVQTEESAKFDGMPRSAISTGLADFILTPDKMPEQIISYAKHPSTNKNENTELLFNNEEEGLSRIFSLVREKTKVDFTYYKPNTVIRRIERRMMVNQIENLKDYVLFIINNQKEQTTLYRDLLIGVTNFFRDSEAFDFLSETVIPDLLERNANKEIRFWVAGCSTGEEAYSIAILAREGMDKLGKSFDLKIFATDIDKDSIFRAGQGIYPDSIAADIPHKLLAKYFYRKDDSYQIVRSIREMVIFAHHNVIKDPPFTNISLVSCRNLLIYFQPMLQKKVFEFFNFSLNPQGILFLGKSETVGDMTDYFEPIHPKLKILRSKGKQKPGGTNIDITIPFNSMEKMSYDSQKKREQYVQIYEEDRILDRFIKSISGIYLPITLIVNEGMEILYVVGDMSGYFTLPFGKMSNDVTKMAIKELAIPLSTGMRKAIDSKETSQYSGIRIKTTNATKHLKLIIMPLSQKKGQEPLYGIFIETIQETKTNQKDEIQKYDLTAEAEQRIADLEQELQYTGENLQATIEELETSNEELQATNEELLASNEELQSTNEELQSTNEELYTVNSEYQGKIIELTKLSNDIDNLINGTKIASLFLDRELKIRRYTPEVVKLFSIIQTDLNRPLSHIRSKLIKEDDLILKIKEVVQTNISYKKEVKTENYNHFLMNIIPFQISPETYEGVVVSFFEITELVQIREALEKSEAKFQLVTQTDKIGIWDLNIVTGAFTCSESMESFFGFNKGLLKKNYNSFLNCIHKDDRMLVKQSFQDAINNEKHYSIVYRVVWEDGCTIRWISETGTVFKNDLGEPITVRGVVRDITDYKRSIDFKNSILYSINQGLVVYDKDFCHQEWNKFMEKFSGYSAEEVIGKFAFDIFPHLKEQKVDTIIYKAMHGETVFSPITIYVNPVTKEKRKYIATYSPHYNNDNEIIGVIGIITDVTML